MARIPFGHCNLVTDEHSQAYRRAGAAVSPQITIPQFRARLHIADARKLAEDLAAAIAEAERIAAPPV
jgi:hypothetical protein